MLGQQVFRVAYCALRPQHALRTRGDWLALAGVDGQLLFKLAVKVRSFSDVGSVFDGFVREIGQGGLVAVKGAGCRAGSLVAG